MSEYIALGQVTAECPHCDVSESFDDEWTARAYLNQHIQQEHADEFPDE